MSGGQDRAAAIRRLALAAAVRSERIRQAISSAAPGTGTPAHADAAPAAGWTGIRLAGNESTPGLHALAASPALTVIVRPDRVIAAVAAGYRLPQLPWHVPATAARGGPATARPSVHPEPAHQLPPAP